jgi:hypothetical protein
LSVRTARWLGFVGLFLLLPCPMLVFDAVVPAVRYVILAAAALLVLLAEGGAGPVPAIVLLFGLHAVFYTAIAWILSWAATHLVSRVAPRALAPLTWMALAAGFTIALVFEPNRTPFGLRATSGLLDILS